jgi:hypothetical protein
MVSGTRVGYDYFAGRKNDSKIRLVGSGTSPPGASHLLREALWRHEDMSLAIRVTDV